MTCTDAVKPAVTMDRYKAQQDELKRIDLKGNLQTSNIVLKVD